MLPGEGCDNLMLKGLQPAARQPGQHGTEEAQGRRASNTTTFLDLPRINMYLGIDTEGGTKLGHLGSVLQSLRYLLPRQPPSLGPRRAVGQGVGEKCILKNCINS